MENTDHQEPLKLSVPEIYGSEIEAPIAYKDGGLTAVITAIKVGAAVYSMVSALTDSSGRDQARLLKSINENLGKLVALQVEILDEIRRLRIFFREELRREFIFNVTTELKSHIDSFTILLAKHMKDDFSQFADDDLDEKGFPRKFVRAVRELLKVVLPIGLRLRHYGPAAYESAHLGMNFIKVLYVIVGESRRGQEATFGLFEQSTEEWLDPKIGTSYPSQIDASIASRENAVAAISAQPREVFKQNLNCSCHLRSCSEEEWIIITGSLGSAFGYRLVKRNQNCSGSMDAILDAKIFENEEGVSILTTIAESIKDENIDESAIHALAHKDEKDLEHGIVNRLNSYRATYFQEEHRILNLKEAVKGVKRMNAAAQQYQQVD